MKIIIITGQTATGKTKYALELAQKYNGELINCDSRQICKHLDIITGKDIGETKFKKIITLNGFDIGYYKLKCFMFYVPCSIKLWLYDIIDPKQYFSSFNFVQCAIPLIKKLFEQKKTVIVVGGTYLYLQHLLYDVKTENIPPNWILRKELGKKSVHELQKIYEYLYVQSFNLPAFLAGRLNNSEKNNPQRLIRRIEIMKRMKNTEAIEPRGLNEMTLANKLGVKNLRVQFLGLRFKNKEKLREAIINRVEERLKKGAAEEVKRLTNMGYRQTDPGLKTIGYQQIIRYLKGMITKKEAIKQWITKELQYAKRQYVFMKRDRNIRWIEV